jgi:lycopene cyclase domain-containing protein
VTYLLMSIPFLVVAAVVLVVARRRSVGPVTAALGVALLVLLVMTAVFDNLMIGAGLVAYGEGHRLGAAIGLAPVEDFAYPIAGVLLLPAVWHLLGGTVARAGTQAER